MILTDTFWNALLALPQELQQIVEHHWVPVDLETGLVLGEHPSQLRLLVPGEQVPLQVEMALLHLNMNEFFLID